MFKAWENNYFGCNETSTVMFIVFHHDLFLILGSLSATNLDLPFVFEVIWRLTLSQFDQVVISSGSYTCSMILQKSFRVCQSYAFQVENFYSCDH